MSPSSSSSSSDSEHAPATAPPRKKQRIAKDVADSDNDTRSNDSDSSDSDVQSASESEEEDAEEEAPVLSHAEKRRQKKKEQRSTKDAAEPEGEAKESKGKEKVKNSADLPPSKLPKRQNSVWVGNLSFKTTPESLKSFFNGVGEITRIHMPTKMATGGRDGQGPRKENRGFAYVDFATPDAKTIAITLSENPLDGRRLLIKDGDDFKGRPAPAAVASTEGEGTPATSKGTGHTKTAQKILSVQKQPPAPTLFLGNLGFEASEESIRELLEAHRAKDAAADDKWIRKVRLGTFEDSGKCKGWAFVDFTSVEHATAALTNPRNHHLNGRKLVVEYASPDAVRRGGGGPPRDKDKDGDPHKSKSREGGKVRPGKRERVANRAGGADGEDVEAGDEDAEERAPPTKRRRSEGEEGARERKGVGRDARRSGQTARRAKPGAALAQAQREAVSIVPSQGKKIVF